MLNFRPRYFVRPLTATLNARKLIYVGHHSSHLSQVFNPRTRHDRFNFSSSAHWKSKRSVWSSLKILAKDSPILVPVALILMIISSGILLWTNKYYSDYIIGVFHTFPEPVAKQLRKAIFYTNVDFKPGMAMKYYKEAIRVAEEHGVDRFSDEMMGIKVQIALLLEKCEKYDKAVEVLESIRSDNLKWLEVVGLREGWEARRNKVLQKTVQISVKLGDLYSNNYVLEQELAEERLTWAVEQTLKELQRREREGVKEDEGPWFDDDQIGTQFETLAHMHEEKNRHYLSAPLFLQALNLSPPGSCHTTVLMNNLSSSLAQQIPPVGYPMEQATRDSLLSNATAWAENAIALANKIHPPERNEECDTGCAVATHNLGELAEMRGNLADAKRKYEEAAQLSRKIGFKEGIKRATSALNRMENKKIEATNAKL